MFKNSTLWSMALALFLLLSFAVILHLQLPVLASSNLKTMLKDSREEVQFPILMYHGLTEDPAKTGEYVILASDFEKDLKWLSDNNYTTVSFAQLADYVENGSQLPEKPVLITFDDGFYKNYALGLPLLQKYNAKAVINLIGSESDYYSNQIYRPEGGGNINWGEVKQLADSGLVEIGNHTYNLHHNEEGSRKGADRMEGESMEDYRQVLLDDLGRNQELIAEATGSPAIVFAWPYGAWPTDGSADPILKELGFKGSLTSYQIMNTIKRGDPDSLFGLKRFLRTPDFDIASAFGAT